MENRKRNLKLSCNQYRNIKGKKYECYTCDTLIFDEIARECKILELSYRIIKDPTSGGLCLYREVKNKQRWDIVFT